MKLNVYASIFILLLVMQIACQSDKTEKVSDSISFSHDKITPADFPKLDIPDFNFPEDSMVLNHWIRENDTSEIYAHAWGIWAGLTSRTNQKASNQELLVYETWLTPAEMIDSINGKPIIRSNRANLKKPNQFTHFQQSVNDSIHESVSYSPSAANHAISNKLFLASTLYDYSKRGMTDIPEFPNDAITIKPVFKILPSSTSKGQDKFAISTWHGTIDSLSAFPEKDWHSCVYVDINNNSKGDGSQLSYPNSDTPPPPTSTTTYNLNDFIHYTMNAEDAYYFNKEFSENSGNKMTANIGDIVILVAMHVTTKENRKWTWQSYWWAPDSDNPPTPSSKAIANKRPQMLSDAASHYAMTVAYYMVNPKEPYSGTDITGKPNYAFNPYLEAGFGPKIFDDDLSYVNDENGDKIPTYVGVRTNCMSCHSMATSDPLRLDSSSKSVTPYIGNSYISFDDTIYHKQLKLDFAWSIEGNIDTTGFKEFKLNYSK